MLKTKAEVFAPTDGWAFLYMRSDEWYRKGLDWTGAEGLVNWLQLPYASMLVREDDVALAQANGQQVTLKLKVPNAPSLSCDMVARVNGSNYDVTRIDPERREAYLYLSEQTSDGTVALVSKEFRTSKYGESSFEEVPTEVVAVKCQVGSDEGQPTLQVTLRSCDYSGEQVVARGGTVTDGRVEGGTRYTVRSATGDGERTVLECLREVKDVR